MYVCMYVYIYIYIYIYGQAKWSDTFVVLIKDKVKKQKSVFIFEKYI